MDLKNQFSLKEFIVDFFGALMPGVFFLFFLVMSFFSSVIFATEILQCANGNCNEMYILIRALKNFFISIGAIGILSLFILFLSIGYAIGTLFYRRDPKYPDYRSFIKIASKFSKPEELENWVVRIKMKSREEAKGRIKKLRFYNRLYYHFIGFKKVKEQLPEKLPDSNEYINDPKQINMLTVN